jgi:hypothetical protein
VELELVGGGRGRKWRRRVNTVQILCAQVRKWKTIETIPGMGRGEIKENGGWGEFKYDIFDTL